MDVRIDIPLADPDPVADPLALASDAAWIENQPYDGLRIGQRAELHRVLTEHDIHVFALMSGDINPAHVDPSYAATTRFGGVIAHGMWAGALISTVLGMALPGPGTIYLGQSLRFHRPVRPGDALCVALTVREKNDANRNVTLDCEVTNQHGETVVSGEALVRAPSHKLRVPRAALTALQMHPAEATLSLNASGAAHAELPLPA